MVFVAVIILIHFCFSDPFVDHIIVSHIVLFICLIILILILMSKTAITMTLMNDDVESVVCVILSVSLSLIHSLIPSDHDDDDDSLS